MMRRRSVIPGVIVLAAMTFSFGETVWASTCLPGMDMESSAMAMAGEAPAEHDRMADAGAAPDQHGEPDSSDNCPFGPLATTQSCAGLASLPASVVAFIAPSPQGAAHVVFDVTQHDLLLETALFHPPRA